MNNKYKTLSIILLVLTICSVFLGVLLIFILSQLQWLKDFVSYFIEHAWIMYIFLVFPTASIVLGVITIVKRKIDWKNIIAGLLCLVMILSLGGLYSLKNTIKHNWSYVTEQGLDTQWLYGCKGEIVRGPINNNQIRISKIKLDQEDKETQYARVTAGAKGMSPEDFDFNDFPTLAKYKYMFKGYDRYIVAVDYVWPKDAKEEKGKKYYFFAYNLKKDEMIMVEFIGQ